MPFWFYFREFILTPALSKNRNFLSHSAFTFLEKRGFIWILFPLVVTFHRIFFSENKRNWILYGGACLGLLFQIYRFFLLRYVFLDDDLLPLLPGVLPLFVLAGIIRAWVNLRDSIYEHLWLWNPKITEDLLRNPWLFMKPGGAKDGLKLAWNMATHHYHPT